MPFMMAPVDGAVASAAALSMSAAIGWLARLYVSERSQNR